MVIFKPEMVKPLREKMGATQEDLARMIGVGVRSVAAWESKESPKKIQRQARIKLIKLHKKWMVS